MAAFPATPIDTTQALTRWGGLYGSVERFVLDTNSKTWQEIPPAVLEWHHDAIDGLSPAAFSQLLPAFLSALLGGEAISQLPRWLADSLTPRAGDQRFDLRVEQLTAEQRHVVAMVFASVNTERARNDVPQLDFLENALAAYWRRRGANVEE